MGTRPGQLTKEVQAGSTLYITKKIRNIFAISVAVISFFAIMVGTTLASPVFGYVDHPALQTLCGITAVSTVVSAISYLVSKDTYKLLKKRPQL